MKWRMSKEQGRIVKRLQDKGLYVDVHTKRKVEGLVEVCKGITLWLQHLDLNNRRAAADINIFDLVDAHYAQYEEGGDK